jgi:hypothetical protein
MKESNITPMIPCRLLLERYRDSLGNQRGTAKGIVIRQHELSISMNEAIMAWHDASMNLDDKKKDLVILHIEGR